MDNLKARISSHVAKMQSNKVPSNESTLLKVGRDVPGAMQRFSWKLQDYSIIEEICQNRLSVIYKAVCKLSGSKVALKVYDTTNFNAINFQQAQREVDIHSRLEHVNILALYAAFQEGNKLVLVEQLAEGGDLFGLVHDRGGKLREELVVSWVIRPMCEAVTHMHAQGLIHRDIKPENIVLGSDLQLKLADFGLAINVNQERPLSRVGTLDYMAPEILSCPSNKQRAQMVQDHQELHPYSSSVDVWALGVLAYEMIVGTAPFKLSQNKATKEINMITEPNFLEPLSRHAKDFFQAACLKDPSLRPTAVQLLNHPWLTKGQAVADPSSPLPQTPV